MNKEELIEIIKNEKKYESLKELVKEYILGENDINYLVNLNINEDIKKNIYQIIIELCLENYFFEIIDEKDRVLFIKILCKKENYISYLCINYLNKIDNLNLLSLKELRLILENSGLNDLNDLINVLGFKKTEQIVDMFLTIDNAEFIIPIIDKLNKKERYKLYEKAVLGVDNFKSIIELLEDKFKFDLINYYIDNNLNNYDISLYIIENDLIKNNEENFKIIENGSSTLIYNSLMNYDLDETKKQKLEKALLRTNDFEYIIYYYFYKNKYIFYKLFCSPIVFLAFVRVNEKVFKNKNIINNIVNQVKEEIPSINIYIDNNLENIKQKVMKK